ncbi:phospholipase D-like domain-containing protein [Lysobacter sp. LF1]|uniref:Phospholipase D-like domain-containing protein n=1 Tax=Lysobacter stagni TaxID=3045172 RepID=A0ABT6XH15_9GAMM|nr:phospholipase D-like domain-containing protein [Lysobacter sp. LF1]MDI9239452.1 phospholipase D-like domain-containing protein [Lysobacter sp. LF1]
MDLIARPMPLNLVAELPADASVKKLANFHIKHLPDCERVRAAIAYASRDNMQLLDSCMGQSKALEFFGRYDGSCPIDPMILDWFLKRNSPNFQYFAVPKWLHAKVIWYVGAGAYIGSANMTDRAWIKNFEAGLFLTHEELDHFGLLEELVAFFDGLRAVAKPLTDEMCKAQWALFKQREQLERQLSRVAEAFDTTDSFVNGAQDPIPAVVARTEATRYARFASEWEETLQHMRGLAAQVVANRPDWIDSNVPGGVQADQFLHAYYYQTVRGEQVKDSYKVFHDRNRKNPQAALQSALDDWRIGAFDFEWEDRTIREWAPTIRAAFAKDRIRGLTESQWVEAATRVHALRDHGVKMSNRLLGLPEVQQDEDTKHEAFARWLWIQRGAGGSSILDLLYFVIWGDGNLTQRLWDGIHSAAWRIPHIGVSILGEIVGWANPDMYPPRNQRSSKALRALGYDVNVSL